ncbi:MAG: cation diffusion facilitator family transporter [bacterium]
MSHDHHHDRQGRSLVISIVLNLGFAVAELVFGLLANSLVLVADAVHDTGDAIALGLSWFGLRISRRKPNARRTFGYRKVRILTAFINALFLFGVTAFIVQAAIGRILNPEPVQSSILIIIAVVGLVVNGAAVLLLRRDRHSLNIRAALWHMLEDFLGWVAVLIGGIVIRLTGWYVIDPILSLVVSAFVLSGAWSVFREATSILIDSTPRDVVFAEVRNSILEFDPDITGIHDLHIWTLGEGERALMAHLVVPDRPLSDFYPMLARLECELGQRFRIDHITLELECGQCKSGEHICLS